MALLEVKNIRKQKGESIFVDDISFKQEAFEKIAIAGESGAGKSTLLKMIGAHVQPTSGIILFNGERVIGPDEKLLPGHKHIAYLSQHYELRNNYRVEELVSIENKLDYQEAAQLFKICRIDHLLQRRTDELSGGEKQRISLCILLAGKPKLLMLDEPFSNLDPIHTETLKAALADITGKLQITCLLTSHDPHDTLAWADKILVLKEGKIIQQGTPGAIYYTPANEYVAGMFGKYNLLKPAVAALFGIESNGNDMILRPEDFIITLPGNGVKSVIEKISFWGSFYEASVLVEDFSVIIRMTENHCKVGDQQYLQVIKIKK